MQKHGHRPIILLVEQYTHRDPQERLNEKVAADREIEKY